MTYKEIIFVFVVLVMIFAFYWFMVRDPKNKKKTFWVLQVQDHKGELIQHWLHKDFRTLTREPHKAFCTYSKQECEKVRIHPKIKRFTLVSVEMKQTKVILNK